MHAMVHRRSLIAATVIALAGLGSWQTGAQERLPIFDTHVHYGQNDWSAYPTGKVFELFDAAGVPRVLASSTPDDGTLKLHAVDASRVVPILRPYRNGVTSSNWFRDPNLSAYLEQRLKAGVYAGIGEFHLFDEAAVSTPQVKRVTELAVERDILLHVHSGAGPVRALFALEPKLKILWAHAGMTEPPDVVAEMLDRNARLWTEVSFRSGDIAPAGKLAERWRALFERHPGRVMIGTDTYVTSRWDSYTRIVEEHRQWLMQLPRDLAEAIAYRNAVRVFGAGGRAELRD